MSKYAEHTLSNPVFLVRAILAQSYSRRGNLQGLAMLQYLNACVQRRIEASK